MEYLKCEARIDSLAHTDPWAKAGVMIRESPAADSKHAFCCMTASHGTSFLNRRRTGEISWSCETPGLAAPCWVKLVREDNKFSAYYSSDGVTWIPQAADPWTPNPQTIAMAPDVCIGLAVTSRNPSRTVEAHFSHVTTDGNVTVPGAFIQSQDITLQLP